MQKMFGLCEANDGTKWMNRCKPEQVGTKEHGKMLKRIQVLEDGRVLPRRQETGRLKDKRGKLLGRQVEKTVK